MKITFFKGKAACEGDMNKTLFPLYVSSIGYKIYRVRLDMEIDSRMA
jgi:hypothetical protein